LRGETALTHLREGRNPVCRKSPWKKPFPKKNESVFEDPDDSVRE
jgi:hypothetical protein